MGVHRVTRSAGSRRRPAAATASAVLLGAALLAGSATSAPAVVASSGSVADPLGTGPGAVPSTGLAATTSAYRLEYASVNSGRTRLLLRWNPCQTITFRINVAAVPSTRRTAVIDELRAAVTRLSTATGIPFSYKGTTSEVPRTTNIDRQSAELIIAVTSPRSTDIGIGGDVLGYGGYNYWTWTTTSASGTRAYGAAISRGWVVLDVTGFLRLRSGFGAGLYQGNVVLHELAHSLGLDHVTDPRQLMYPTLTTGSPSGYASGDLTGLTKVGRAAGCIAVPSGTFADLR